MNPSELPAQVGSNDGLGAWLPIETAPRDGTEILLWVYGRRLIGAWRPYSDPSYPFVWQDEDGRAISRPWKDDEEPTMWALLLDAPNVANEAGLTARAEVSSKP